MTSRAVLRRLSNALVLGLAEAAVVLGLAAVLAGSAAAQNRDDRFPWLEQRSHRGGGSGGGGWFGGGGGWFGNPNEQRPAPVVENNSKAPPPAKKAADAAAPLTSVVVLGDSMADWLAYGLEQAAAESPDIGILRRHRTNSGLIRIEVRSDPRGEYPDWPPTARDILNADKASFIVVMLGLNDRRPIRDKAPAAPKNTAPGASQHAAPADKKSEPKDAERDPGDAPAEQQAATVEPSSERAPAGMVNHEFRSDKWTELYIKRIDDLIAVLKAKNVPVFWVGLPPVRNAKTSGDLSYLNDLYRSRAEKAGITYIDTWDGFVDEQGRFVMRGPDFEGQIRPLRSGDGVHFTQSGARKLAHYVEREIQRSLMTHATPVALPVEEPAPTAPTPPKQPGTTAIARPLAGPVIPLTTVAEADQLLGGAAAKQDTVDPIASRVLVRGEPNRVPVGRADDFAWPRRAVLPLGADPIVATSTTPITPMQPYETRQASASPSATPAQRIGPPAPAPVRQAAAPTAPPRQTSFFGWQQPQQQQQAQRRIEPARQPFFFPFFGGR